MKVAVNRCYGGFGLSNEAVELIAKKKGMNITKVPTAYKFDRVWCLGDLSSFLKLEKTFHTSSEDRKKYLSRKISPYTFYKDRTDKDLLEVIQELGSTVNDRTSNLEIVEIPDDIEWEISEYDGMESIEEKHRRW